MSTRHDKRVCGALILLPINFRRIFPQLDLSTCFFEGEGRSLQGESLAIIVSVVNDHFNFCSPTFIITPTCIGWIDVYFDESDTRRSKLVCLA